MKIIKYEDRKMKKHVKKTTCGKILLHNLHGQFTGFLIFILNLNFSRLLLLLM